jgi:hypothetical protein
MPRTHRAFGLSITYPDNWQVTEEIETGEPDIDPNELDTDEDELGQEDNQRVVGYQVQSPNSAFVSVYPFDPSTSPKEAIAQAAEAIGSEYDNVEQDSFEPQLVYHPGTLSDPQGEELHFYYLDLLVYARLIAFRLPSQTILVHFQAEDGEFRGLEKVFEAMLLTLCQSIQK